MTNVASEASEWREKVIAEALDAAFGVAAAYGPIGEAIGHQLVARARQRPEAADIQRYNVEPVTKFGHDGASLQYTTDAEGEWVKWEDVRRFLPEANDAVRIPLAKLREVYDEIRSLLPQSGKEGEQK